MGKEAPGREDRGRRGACCHPWASRTPEPGPSQLGIQIFVEPVSGQMDRLTDGWDGWAGSNLENQEGSEGGAGKPADPKLRTRPEAAWRPEPQLFAKGPELGGRLHLREDGRPPRAGQVAGHWFRQLWRTRVRKAGAQGGGLGEGSAGQSSRQPEAISLWVRAFSLLRPP
ncbi:hypothetical protein H1C71_032571 [Ictidomys tridecemlineatus]|nr:hypothetical protein H1C71_032571 [Ictidomys tridecemlineatus]